jgi:hypothetical protein
MYSLQAYASNVPIVIGSTPARVGKFYAQLSCFLFLEDYGQHGVCFIYMVVWMMWDKDMDKCFWAVAARYEI